MEEEEEEEEEKEEEVEEEEEEEERVVFIFSRLFFLALFLTLADFEVRKVLLNTEGGESGLTAVQPTLLDNLRHTTEYLREEGGGE